MVTKLAMFVAVAFIVAAAVVVILFPSMTIVKKQCVTEFCIRNLTPLTSYVVKHHCGRKRLGLARGQRMTSYPDSIRIRDQKAVALL